MQVCHAYQNLGDSGLWEECFEIKLIESFILISACCLIRNLLQEIKIQCVFTMRNVLCNVLSFIEIKLSKSSQETEHTFCNKLYNRKS